MLEREIQKKCLDWLLKEARFFAWRSNTTGVFDRELGFFRTGPKRGISDIIAVAPPMGRIIGVEVKSATGRISEDQKNFKKNLEEAGGLYWLVRSLDDLKELCYNYHVEEKKA